MSRAGVMASLVLVLRLGLLSCHPATYNTACSFYTVETYTIKDAPHVPDGTVVDYVSNPPCGGPHYAEWLPFGVFDHEVRAGNYVHNLEHGAMVLLYNCPTGCADMTTAFVSWAKSVKADDGGPFRWILAPWPSMPTRVAAVTWGAVYRSDVVDPCGLDQFKADHYRKAPEDVSAPGSATP